MREARSAGKLRGKKGRDAALKRVGILLISGNLGPQCTKLALRLLLCVVARLQLSFILVEELLLVVGHLFQPVQLGRGQFQVIVDFSGPKQGFRQRRIRLADLGDPLLKIRCVSWVGSDAKRRGGSIAA